MSSSVVAGVAVALAVSGCVGVGGSSQPVTPIRVDAAGTARLVSAYRAESGLGPVTISSSLMQAAAGQARAMGERDRIGHNVAGSLPRRVTEAGYDWGTVVENLGGGYPSVEAAIAGWWDSAEHRRNLLNESVTEIGIAAVATSPGSLQPNYWAMILAAPRPEPVPAGPFAAWPFGRGAAQ